MVVVPHQVHAPLAVGRDLGERLVVTRRRVVRHLALRPLQPIARARHHHVARVAREVAGARRVHAREQQVGALARLRVLDRRANEIRAVRRQREHHGRLPAAERAQRESVRGQATRAEQAQETFGALAGRRRQEEHRGLTHVPGEREEVEVGGAAVAARHRLPQRDRIGLRGRVVALDLGHHARATQRIGLPVHGFVPGHVHRALPLAAVIHGDRRELHAEAAVETGRAAHEVRRQAGLARALADVDARAERTAAVVAAHDAHVIREVREIGDRVHHVEFAVRPHGRARALHALGRGVGQDQWHRPRPPLIARAHDLDLVAVRREEVRVAHVEHARALVDRDPLLVELALPRRQCRHDRLLEHEHVVHEPPAAHRHRQRHAGARIELRVIHVALGIDRERRVAQQLIIGAVRQDAAVLPRPAAVDRVAVAREAARATRVERVVPARDHEPAERHDRVLGLRAGRGITGRVVRHRVRAHERRGLGMQRAEWGEHAGRLHGFGLDHPGPPRRLEHGQEPARERHRIAELPARGQRRDHGRLARRLTFCLGERAIGRMHGGGEADRQAECDEQAMQ